MKKNKILFFSILSLIVFLIGKGALLMYYNYYYDYYDDILFLIAKVAFLTVMIGYCLILLMNKNENNKINFIIPILALVGMIGLNSESVLSYLEINHLYDSMHGNLPIEETIFITVDSYYRTIFHELLTIFTNIIITFVMIATILPISKITKVYLYKDEIMEQMIITFQVSVIIVAFFQIIKLLLMVQEFILLDLINVIIYLHVAFVTFYFIKTKQHDKQSKLESMNFNYW